MTTRHAIRILSLLLALCLAPLPGALGAQAPVKELFGDRLIDGEDSLRSVAVLDGTVYLLTSRAFYRFDAGDREARRVADAPQNPQVEPTAVDSLFVHAGQLKAFNNQSGDIFTVAYEQDAVKLTPALKLDLSDFESEGGGPLKWIQRFNRLVVLGDRLFARLPNWGGDLEKDLYSFDLNTGERKVYSPKHLQGLVPYKDGRLIGIRFDQNVTDPDTFEQMDGELTVFDPATDKAEKLDWPLPEDRQGKNRDLRLYYDAAGGILYASNDSGVMRLSPDRAPELVARLPMSGSWSWMEGVPSLVPLDGGRVLVAFNNNAFIRSTDPAQMPPVTTLSVNSGGYDSYALSKALMHMDDIDLQFYQGDYLDAEALSARFLTGDMDFDLLILYSSEHDMEKLIKKGYLADLSGSEALVRLTDDMLEAVQPLIHRDGRLYALPMDLQTYYLTGNVQNFRDVGRQMPRSVPELLELTRWWAEEGHAAHEGYTLFDQADARRLIKDLIHTVYVDALLGAGKPLQFDMEHYGRLMQEVDAIDFSSFDVLPSDLSEDYEGMLEGKPLLMAYMGYDAAYPYLSDKYEVCLELSLDGDTPAYREGRAVFTAIPSTSKHKEAALRFLERYMDNLKPTAKAGMSRSWDQAIEDPNWQWGYARLQETLKEYQRLYEEAEEGPQKRQFAEDVKHMQESLDTYEEDNRYRLTADMIKRHQAMMKLVFLNGSLGMTQRQALVKDEYLVGMYHEGALTLEQFIQQANDKIRLMTLEAE